MKDDTVGDHEHCGLCWRKSSSWWERLRNSGGRLVTNDSGNRPTNEYVLNVAFVSFLGFVVCQTVFALVANSQSMLADSEAMAVDSLTYLFNLMAENIKKRPTTEFELRQMPKVRAYRRELRRLYLELVPPGISVVTLIIITVMTMREAFATLLAKGKGDDGSDEVSVPIMLIFSFGNLLLDAVNVACFARAQSTYGFNVLREETTSMRKSWRHEFDLPEASSLLQQEQHLQNGAHDDNNVATDDETADWPAPGRLTASFTSTYGTDGSSPLLDSPSVLHRKTASAPETQLPAPVRALINLNMCSAWTHVCADTLRSIAVLVAAALATLIPFIDGRSADSVAAIVVSVIILVSLVPLLQGLVLTSMQIHHAHQHPVKDMWSPEPSDDTAAAAAVVRNGEDGVP